MTTIAANKKQIACDLQLTGGFKMKAKTKIWEPHTAVSERFFKTDRSYIGFAGTAYRIAEAVEWLLEPSGRVPRFPGMQCLALTNDQRLFYSDNFAHWIESETPVAAVGSGMQFAIVALGDGKDPIDACKVASKYDPNTGCGYKKYEF